MAKKTGVHDGSAPYGMFQSELDSNAECQKNHREHWVVLMRNANVSAFNGYRLTPSAYSRVECQAEGCGRNWRTKAAYVSSLPDG